MYLINLLLNVAVSILSLRVSLVSSEYVWTGEEWKWREPNNIELDGIERAPREFEGSGQVNLLHDEEDSMQSSLFLPNPQIETSGESISDDEDFNEKPKLKKPPTDKSRNRENEKLLVDKQSPRSGMKMNLPSKDIEITLGSHEKSQSSRLSSSQILLSVFFLFLSESQIFLIK